MRSIPTARLLVRHFWGRFFDTESLSPQGDPQANVKQALGVLAVPGAFFVLICQPLSLRDWDLVAVRYWFISFSMVAMAFLTVLEWEALFPDRRDFQVLTPLPIPLSTLFLTKIAALALFLGVFLVDINFFSMVFWPGIDGGHGLLPIMAAHIGAVALAGLFAALAMAAVQGVLITVLPARTFHRAAVALQTLLMAALVMLLFLTPVLAGGLHRFAARNSALFYYFPGYWFVGLYERLRPAVGDPLLLEVGGRAMRALVMVAAVFLLTYLPLYRRHARKFLEAPAPSAFAGMRRGPNVFAGMLLKHPVERAVFAFMTQTIRRSAKHRIFLATYGGFGAALAITHLVSGRDGLLRLPLTLSFILVSGLRAAFNYPSELRANWIFQTTEAHDASHYLAAMRKWIVVCAIVPLFAVLAAMEFALFAPRTALLHLAFGITLSVLLMDVMFFGFRKVPFTCAHFPGRMNLAGLGALYLLGLTVYSHAMALVEAWLGQAPLAAMVFLPAALGARVGLARWRLQRWREKLRLDFEDAGDPVVRTLDLT